MLLVHVADDRVGDLARRVGEQRDRADADHLVHARGEREPGAGEPAILGDQTPQQMTTLSVAISPALVVTIPVTRPAFH